MVSRDTVGTIWSFLSDTKGFTWWRVKHDKTVDKPQNKPWRDPNLPPQYGIIFTVNFLLRIKPSGKQNNLILKWIKTFWNELKLFWNESYSLLFWSNVCTNDRDIYNMYRDLRVMMTSLSGDCRCEFVEHGEPWFLKPRWSPPDV